MTAPADTTAPATSQVYTWEPSDAAIAARYGLRAKDILRFDTNTSPLPPAFAPDVLAGAFDPTLNEYPDSSYADLTDAAATYVGVATERLIVGAGADEILDLIGKAYLPEAATALIPVPTYAMYSVLSSQRAADVVRVLRLGPQDGYAIDLESFLPLVADAAVIWLCSPNNPTGAVEPPATLESILNAAADRPEPPIVVIDEAYAEFVEWSAIDWLDRFPNLVVVRTVSKAFALAGMRVGYGISSRGVIARLQTVRPPGSISTPSATLAAAALRRPETARENATGLAIEREWLRDALMAAGWIVAPSATNFVLLRAGIATDADALGEQLLRAGIVPRTFPAEHPLAGHLRLTVRARHENERLLAAIGSPAT
ncbi:MAG: histidinol-phosphate transaminase [Candidatus Limnocylindrales bacterium]